MDRKPRKPSRGFTIIELMIALVVIAVMAATVVPSLSEVLADNRQTSAAMDIVRAARETRARAITRGLAMLLRYQGTDNAAGAHGLGKLTMHVGMNSKCTQTPWEQTITPAMGARQRYDRFLNMADFNPTDGETTPTADDHGRHVIQLEARFVSANQALEAATVRSETRVCYQPNGDIYASHSDGQLAMQTQPLVITIGRSIDGVTYGQQRQVLFPVGGNARLR